MGSGEGERAPCTLSALARPSCAHFFLTKVQDPTRCARDEDHKELEQLDIARVHAAVASLGGWELRDALQTQKRTRSKRVPKELRRGDMTGISPRVSRKKSLLLE